MRFWEATRPAPMRPLIHRAISSSSHNVSSDLLAWLAKPDGSYDELLRMREKRKKEAEKAKQPPRRRVRLPRAKPKGED
jgi:hypothetical protein